jgi:hypothetical protein
LCVPTQTLHRPQFCRLCRHITRPALSDERVQINAAGQVELKLKMPWRDGTTHLVMSPLVFMKRLAAPKPRSRLRPRMTALRTAANLGSRMPGLGRVETLRADAVGAFPGVIDAGVVIGRRFPAR